MPDARGGLWAVVPVKLFPETKQRLAPLLSRDEREALACAMLRDVLSALAAARGLAGVVVVTADGQAAAIARDAGALVIPDIENAGTRAAAVRAAQHLVAWGYRGMLVIPADVPLITMADIDAIVEAHGPNAPAVTLVPASADGGTNALACSPPDAIPLHFGEESFERHREAARAHGIEPQIVHLPRVGQDIDRPEDVAELLMRPSPTQSFACLRRLAIAERLRGEAMGSLS
jgi:2-phospho-L-lactate guanylyltransferase